MSERGYPAEDPAQAMADLSVEHASTLQDFRTAQEISQKTPSASTEELRQAMIHYRALFSDLLGRPEEVETAVTEDSTSAARVPAGEPGIQTAPRARR